MKITVNNLGQAVIRAGQYLDSGYRVTYTSGNKIVLARLPNPKYVNLPKEILIYVRSSSG